MKRGLGLSAILVVIGIALYLVFNIKNPDPTAVAPSSENSSADQTGATAGVSSAGKDSNPPQAVSSQPPMQPQSLAATAGQFVPASNSAVELPPETVLQNVRRAIHQYGDMFGGNPVGTNPEITSQLTGDNPKHINFIAAQPNMSVNAEGELIDPWGTPYFFHQISGEETEVHSAGPDKVMWTADDLVVR
jgi:hypothetical protein